MNPDVSTSLAKCPPIIIRDKPTIDPNTMVIIYILEKYSPVVT